MKIIDITRPLSNSTVVYPGDTPPFFTQHDQGRYLISDLCMNSHSGTHIDAPAHYLKKGDTIDTISLSRMVGPCRVLDVSHAGREISEPVLRDRIGGASRVLLKTAFSTCTTFREDYPSLTHDAAHYLIKKGVQCDGAVHRELLGNDCIVIELLDLSGVEEGDYSMVALPLRLSGLDGAPARVILLEDEAHT